MKVHQSANKETPLTFSDQARRSLKWFINGLANIFIKLGMHPNTLTLIGITGTMIASVLIAFGHLTIGGILFLVMGALDGIDGTVARIMGISGSYGAFLDSVGDRYSEIAVFTGIIWYFMEKDQSYFVLTTVFAMAGSILVSYVRARAQSLDCDVKTGILTRFERYLVLGPALIFNIPAIGVIIVALLANFTAFQRIAAFRKINK
ncbi:MAG: CDP-alcohol phosphatidyltransferase family protein [Anaerolineales bacterium]|nr:CDP-alcohol phosphatidyltransferase family protein [Anaerolineales bacterium]